MFFFVHSFFDFPFVFIEQFILYELSQTQFINHIALWGPWDRICIDVVELLNFNVDYKDFVYFYTTKSFFLVWLKGSHFKDIFFKSTLGI